VPVPEREKLSLLTRRVAVRFAVLFGAKLIEKLTLAPGFSVAGRPGTVDRANIVLGAARLMLESVVAVVPTFWMENVKLSLFPTAKGVKITAPPAATGTADDPLLYV
jgi:hypothetical protein